MASVGVNLLNASVLPLPLDLGNFGAPAGTLLYMNPATSFLNTISNIPSARTMSLTLPVPNVPALAGLQVNSQSFWFDFAASPFPFGNIIASHLVICTIG
ncbi:MAG: hypothetical protein ACI89X_003278 [Planctomycetota bacterium]